MDAIDQSQSQTQKISAVIGNEKELEMMINQLLSESVSRSDISVQGSPEQVKDEYGVSFIAPEVIQNSDHPPTKEPFLNDDFGWVLGFSFAIPFFICLICAIFIIGDIRSTQDNILYGLLGAIVGVGAGLAVVIPVKKNHDKKVRKQEHRGGFVLWVTTHTEEQHQQVLFLLKNYHPKIN